MGSCWNPRKLHLPWLHANSPVSLPPVPWALSALTEGSTKRILADNPELEKTWMSLIPQGRMGQSEDLMGPVTSLLPEAASYVTGADLRVDGRYTIT